MKNKSHLMTAQEECQNKKKSCRNILIFTVNKEKKSSNREKSFNENSKELCSQKNFRG